MKKDTTEYCVLCECPTPYKREDEIEKRKHYVEGAGQLCKNCYDLLYNAKK